MAAAQPGIQIAESNGSNERQPGVGMDPVLEAKLDEAAAAYKKLATADIDSLVVNSDKMLAALQANDIPTARQAWIDARAGYERSEIFTIKFPSLDAAINSWPNSETGFHGIEAKLFAPGAPLPLAEAQTLVDKVHTLQRVFNGEPLYAHGVIVGIGGLAFEMGESKAKGGESAISGTSLNDIQHNLEGIELAWNTVFAATMEQKNKGSILKLLLDQQFRATIDETSDKIGAKIRLAQLEKVPYMLVLGAREDKSAKSPSAAAKTAMREPLVRRSL